jgi:hypothetical protein
MAGVEVGFAVASRAVIPGKEAFFT